MRSHRNSKSHGRCRSNNHTFLFIGLLVFITFPSLGSAQFSPTSTACGSLKNAYGPYDYTNPVHKRDRLPIVEFAHFNSDVYNLRRGLSGTEPIGDIDYTLRAFPNHHMALDAMARLHRMEKSNNLPGSTYSIDCWFDRAFRLNPSDSVAHMIYGIHFFYLEQFTQAENELLLAMQLMPNSSEIQYNLGLVYVRLENYELARQYADRAYSLGYPLPGLRNQLVRAGQWTTE